MANEVQSWRCLSLWIKALKNVLQAKNFSNSSISFLDDARSGVHGFSLADVSDFASQAGLNYRLIYRSTGAPLPYPAVIHWKLNHYAAIVGYTNGLYRIQDPTFGGELALTRAAIDAESSGYFLVPSDQFPEQVQGWRIISESSNEAKQVYGMGYTTNSQSGSTKSGDLDIHGKSGANGPPPPDSSSSSSEMKCHGMCAASAHTMVVSLTLNDTPVGYKPPVGPPLYIQLAYHQREANQPATFPFFNVSPKWTLGVLSYIQDNPTAPGVSVTRYAAGGGSVDYNASRPVPASYNATTGQFPPEPQVPRILVRIPATGPATSYELRYSDGSKQVFAHSDGSSVFPRRMFMTQVVDPAGNAQNFHYDSLLRLTSITDATGRDTVFSYGLNSSPLLVTQITDPFGRHADLAYDAAGRLVSITDVLGIVSSFGYDSAGLINTLTTPYGTSRFSYGSGANTSRFLEMTDPLGGVERLEYNINAPFSSIVDSKFPAGPFQNGLAKYRNSFYWDRHALPIARPNASGSADLTLARLTHWLHTQASETAPTIENTKEPLENGVWRSYPGQTSSIYEGTSQAPTLLARVLDNGQTQSRRFSYNAFGLVTQAIDPSLRTTNWIRDSANLIDILRVEQKVSNTSSAAPAVLASYTYNGRHLPLTSKDASGQITSYQYNSAGQISSITNPLNETTLYSYDNVGRLSTITNALGNVQERLSYDAFDRILTRTDSEGLVLNYEYDALDRLTKTNYPDGTNEKRTYNNLNLASVIDRLSRITSYAYDANQRLVSTTDAAGKVTRFAYYENDILKSITDPQGGVTSWDIDIQGRPTVQHKPNGSTETYTYEATTSRLKSIKDSLGQVKTFQYANDDLNTGIQYTGAINPTPNLSFTYDSFFPRLASRTDGNGVTTLAYQDAGSLGALNLASENISSIANGSLAYEYDALGRITKRTLDSTVESFAYDKLSRAIHHTSSLGDFEFSYLGQTNQVAVQQLNASTGAIPIRYGYEANTNDRRLKSIAGPGAARTFGFASDPYRITSITETPGSGSSASERSLIATYDAVDRLLSLKLTAGYSAASAGAATLNASALTTSQNLTSSSSTVSLASTSPTPISTCKNPLTTGNEDEIGCILDHQHIGAHKYNNSILAKLLRAVLIVLHRLGIHLGCGHHGHEHDPGDGQTCPTSPTPSPSASPTPVPTPVATPTPMPTPSVVTFNFVYDNNGNILSLGSPSSVSPTSVSTMAATYNISNEVLTRNDDGGSARSYVYDSNGNLISDGKRTYAWDAENRLVAINYTGASSSTQFKYDALNRRTSIKEISSSGSSETRYLWCGEQVCRADDASTGLVTRRYFTEGEVQTTSSGSQKLVYLKDQLGSVRDVLDANTGAVLASYDYSAYGIQKAVGAPSTVVTDFGYAGLVQHSISGLSLATYRFYDPAVGRFISNDPIRFLGNDTNFYRYAGNNSLTYVDPRGYSMSAGEIAGVGFGIAIGAVVGGGAPYAIGGLLAEFGATGLGGAISAMTIPGALLGGGLVGGLTYSGSSYGAIPGIPGSGINSTPSKSKPFNPEKGPNSCHK